MSDKIEKTITLRAPIERVWRAITDHEEFGAWFRVKIDGPFRLGEPSTGRMTYPGAEHFKWEAEVTRMDAPHHFAFTWPHPADPHAATYAGEPRTLVEFRLEPTADGTRLTIVESGFEAIPADRRPEAMRGNEKGWAEQIGNIRAHVDG
jgi:uncharacterized protein YndB with AHSA1/START domain